MSKDAATTETISMLNGVDQSAEVLVQRVRDELLPEVRSTIKDELTALFDSLKAQFVTKTELNEIKEQRDTEIFTLKTDLANQQGQLSALRDQVSQMSAAERDLRESIKKISNSANEIKNQHDNIALEVKSAIITFQQGVDVLMTTQQQMRVTINTQNEDRRRHDALAQRVTETNDELQGRIRHNEIMIADTEQRYIETFVPMRDFVLGSETQDGLKNVLSGITNKLESLRKEIAPMQTWVAQRRAIELAVRNFATSRKGLLLISIAGGWALNHFIRAAQRGELNTLVPSLINFLLGG